MSTTSPYRRRPAPRPRLALSSSPAWMWLAGVLPLAVAVVGVGYQAHQLRGRVAELEARAAARATLVADRGDRDRAAPPPTADDLADLRAEVDRLRGMVRQADETAIAEAVEEVERRVVERFRVMMQKGLDDLEDYATEVGPNGWPRWLNDLRNVCRAVAYQPPLPVLVSAEDQRRGRERLEQRAREKAERAERRATEWDSNKAQNVRHIIPALPSWLATDEDWRELGELQGRAEDLARSRRNFWSRAEYEHAKESGQEGPTDDQVKAACEKCLAALNRILPKHIRHLTVRDLAKPYLPHDVRQSLRKFEAARKVRKP